MTGHRAPFSAGSREALVSEGHPEAELLPLYKDQHQAWQSEPEDSHSFEGFFQTDANNFSFKRLLELSTGSIQSW